jgi:hypothetical protein
MDENTIHQGGQGPGAQGPIVRCYASVLERNPGDAQPPKWRKANEWESRWPIYVVFSADRAGIHFLCVPAERILGFLGFENNEERYRLLSSTNSSAPVTISLAYFDLFYSLRDPYLQDRILKKEPPPQVELMFLNAAGGDDPAATRELYTAIWEAQRSSD